MITDKLIRITGTSGIYYRDATGNLKGFKEVDTATIQKQLKKELPFEYVVRVRHRNKGTYHTLRFVGTKTAKQALALAEAERTKLHETAKTGRTIGQTPTLNRLFEEYIETRIHGAKPLNPRTLQNYREFYAKWIQAAIGTMSIDQIELEHIQPIADKIRRAGLSPRTQLSVKQTLSPVFQYAIKRRYRQTSPVSLVELPPIRNVKNFELSEEKAKRVYQTILDWPDPTIRAFFLFSFMGRRLNSEGGRIRWEDIDLDNRRYTLTGKENTKTKDSKVFPLTPPMIQALKEMGPKESGYLFEGGSGGQIAARTASRRWEELSKKADAEITAHRCRNLIGHALKTADRIGDDLIAYLLGHSRHSVGVTGRYAFAGYKLTEELTYRYLELIENGGWESAS
ncbi:MAG: tyrosine-type recombinase/integrase [Campylobacterales bacterium]